MLHQVVLPNGRPLRVRVDGGLPLDIAREERVQLLDAPTGTPAPTFVKNELSSTVWVLGAAIGLFVLLSIGIIVAVVVLWIEIDKLANVASSSDIPSIAEVGSFARTLMNSTAKAMRNVEEMTTVSSDLLVESAQTVRHSLNATEGMLRKAQDMLAHPPTIQLGLAG